MLAPFVLFGCAKCSVIVIDLKKLDVLEIHDSFLVYIFDEFSYIWTSEQKVGVPKTLGTFFVGLVSIYHVGV